MSKWKCEICDSEFDKFQAFGFDNKIYCPLCYFKKLYSQTEFERERLNNIIDELEKLIDSYKLGKYDYEIPVYVLEDKLKALKEGK